MGITKVTRNYQITLPKDVRELADIKIGDRVLIIVEDGGITIEVLKRDPIDETFGTWKDEVEGTKYVDKLRSEWKKRRELVG